MKRTKLLCAALAIGSALALAAGLTACDSGKEQEPPASAHEHTYSESWASNSTHHWHWANCEHTAEIGSYAPHEFDASDTLCTVCGYVKVIHQHTYSSEWTSAGASGHYHMATCEHRAEHDELQPHEYDDMYDATCNCCNYVRSVPVAVTGVTVSGAENSVEMEGSLLLQAVIAPENATNKNVTWTSSDPAIATVRKSTEGYAIVTGVSVGNVTITVTTEQGAKTHSYDVSVTPISVKSVNVTPKGELLSIGETLQLSAAVLPANAANKAISSWASSDESIATVSADGLVTARAGGTVTITVTALDGNVTGTCTVNIKTNYTITVKDSENNPVAGARLADANYDVTDETDTRIYTTDSNGQIELSVFGSLTLIHYSALTEAAHSTAYTASKALVLSSDNPNPVITLSPVALTDADLPKTDVNIKTLTPGNYFTKIESVKDDIGTSVGMTYFKLTGAAGGSKYVVTLHDVYGAYNQLDGLRKSTAENGISFSVCLHEGESTSIMLFAQCSVSALPYYYYFSIADDSANLPKEGTTVEYPYLVTLDQELGITSTDSIVYAKVTFADNGLYTVSGDPVKYLQNNTYTPFNTRKYIVEGITYYLQVPVTEGRAAFTVNHHLFDGEKGKPIPVAVSTESETNTNSASIPISYGNGLSGPAERWFRFTATENKSYSLKAGQTGAFLEVFTDVNGSSLGYTYDTKSYAINCIAGTTYYIRVTNETNRGTVTFTFTEVVGAGTQATPVAYTEKDLVNGTLTIAASDETVYCTFTPSQFGLISFTGTGLTVTSDVTNLNLAVFKNSVWNYGGAQLTGCYAYCQTFTDHPLTANETLYFCVSLPTGLTEGTLTVTFTPMEERTVTEYVVTVVNGENNPIGSVEVLLKSAEDATDFLYAGVTDANGTCTYKSVLETVYVVLVKASGKTLTGNMVLTASAPATTLVYADLAMTSLDNAAFHATDAGECTPIEITLGTLYSSTMLPENYTLIKYSITEGGTYTVEAEALQGIVGIQALYVNGFTVNCCVLRNGDDVSEDASGVGHSITLSAGASVNYTAASQQKTANTAVTLTLSAGDYIVIRLVNAASDGTLTQDENAFMLKISKTE